MVRLIQPGLPQYLLAVSQSQGADPTLAGQYGSSPARHGEPYGEVGFVEQSDAAWGLQSGTARDPLNSSTGKIDVKSSAGTRPLYATVAEPVASQVTAALTEAQLASIVTAAKQQWTAVLGAADSRLAAFDTVQMLVGNLPDDRLGVALGGAVILDLTAAGHGWFIDATPWESSEFYVINETLIALPHSLAYGKVDLLTVVSHELGHVLGLEHTSADRAPALMDETVPVGVRRTIASGATDGHIAWDNGAALPVQRERTTPRSWWHPVQRVFWRHEEAELATAGARAGRASGLATAETSQPVLHITWDQAPADTDSRNQRNKTRPSMLPKWSQRSEVAWETGATGPMVSGTAADTHVHGARL